MCMYLDLVCYIGAREVVQKVGKPMPKKWAAFCLHEVN